MRAWIFVLAVLATFQAAIVQVAGTESAAAAMVEHTQSKSQHPRKQHRIATSPVLSFAAIVASAEKSESEFSLTSSNNIVLNSDNVKHPPHADYELLVPTNSPSSSLSTVASPSAKSVVRKINVNFSGNSNSIDSSKPVQRRRSRVNSNQGHLDRVRQRRREENRRRRRQRGHRRSKKSPALSQLEEVRINSNELNVHEEQQQPLEEKVEQKQQQEVEVENEEDEEQQQQEAEQVERAKPDPETLVTIEKNLLSLFGFKKRPKIDRSKVVIPEAMRRMYAETTGMELDLPDLPKPAIHRSHYTANTVRSFTHEESKIDHRFHHHHRFRLHFNTTNIPADELVKAAELVLSRDAVPDADLIRHKVQVFDIVRPGVKGKREPSFLLIDTKIVKVNSTENLVLDVKPALERWQREPKHNHGLLVHVSTVGRRGPKRVQQQQPAEGEGISLDGPMHHHVRLRRSVRESEDSWAKKQPLLFAYTDDKRHRSSRAATKEGGHHHNGGGGRARNRSKKKPRGICQRHALWVDFEDVGWNDWIVAPRGYDAFYCKGECRIPMADHLNATNHAVVQTLVNSINGQLAPRACCVPTQLTTISLLYLDDQNKLVLKKYQDMAVVGCGCR